jgi:hypothetical protein
MKVFWRENSMHGRNEKCSRLLENLKWRKKIWRPKARRRNNADIKRTNFRNVWLVHCYTNTSKTSKSKVQFLSYSILALFLRYKDKNMWNTMIKNNLKHNVSKNIWNTTAQITFDTQRLKQNLKKKTTADKNIRDKTPQKTEIIKCVICSDFHMSVKRERNCACLEQESRCSYKVSVTVVRTNTKQKLFDFFTSFLLSKLIVEQENIRSSATHIFILYIYIIVVRCYCWATCFDSLSSHLHVKT